jgi:lipid II:glycine glycyltransferase (peptidoglycan interpeptide bridge formation enzyme)
MATEIFISNDPNRLKEAGWESFVLTHPDGNFFQLPQAFELFQSVPGYHPSVFGIIEQNKVRGILVSVIQKENAFYGPLTSRSIIWGGPLVSSVSDAEKLLAAYNDFTKKRAIYSQIRNTFDCSLIKPAFEKSGFKFLEHLNFKVPTSGLTTEQLLSQMSKSKSRQIKKGLQSAEIIIATAQKDVDDFYLLLQKTYREKVHKPLPPKVFFDEFFQKTCKQGFGQYLLIKSGEKIIGGIMSPLLPGKAIYEWYIAGLDKEYKEQYPSILATWAAIEYGANNHLGHFDFLGAGKPDQDYGVREFKSKFGGELVHFGRFEKIHNPLLMKVGETGLKIYKYLKR